MSKNTVEAKVFSEAETNTDMMLAKAEFSPVIKGVSKANNEISQMTKIDVNSIVLLS